ncbi:MAG: SurA N-terminal domain-containing protein [Candidatus Omnitrophica bacterium]|nr:SurA N-terminal domain-containing protein [Candidatus Omnitrophota bacterium]
MKRILILISFFMTLLVQAAFSEDRQLVDRVAAVVNNEVITQSEFDVIFRPIYEQLQKTYQGPNLQAELEKLRLQLLNQLIEDRLVYQEAQKLGIEVSDSEIQEELSSFKSQFPDQTRFEQEMEKAGIQLADLEKRVKERISIAKLHQGLIRGRVVVSPNETEQYYKDHPEEFVQKEQVEVWSITLPKGKEAVEKGMMDEAVKRKAEQFIAQLKKGADFEKLAKENSKDVHAEQGGFMGFIQRGDLVDSIDQLLFSLPKGSISDVLETENNYHIFKVGEKREASHKSFKEAESEISDKLFRQKAHERFVQWMDELKKKSYISIR